MIKGEQVNQIKELDYMPFDGGMDIVREIYQLPLGGYSNIKNMRPLRPGFTKRKGCGKLNTTADEANTVVSLYGMSKGKQVEIRFFAQMSDGDVLEATNNPPTVGTTFGDSVYNTTDTTNMLPASWAMLDDALLYCDGTGYPRIFSGGDEYVSGFIVYKSDAVIPDTPKLGEDYSLNVSDGETSTCAVLDSLDVLTESEGIWSGDCVYIKTETPANVFTWEISKPNGSAAVGQMHYYNGSAWTTVGVSFGDTTADAGKTLATTGGAMSFTMPTDLQPKFLFGDNGYWYRFSLVSGALDPDVEVTGVKYNSTWQAIQNVWDGVPVDAIEAYVYKAATATYEYYASDSVEIGGMTSSDKYYFNSDVPIIGFYPSVGDIPNETAAVTATLKYWNGVEFTPYSSINDSTLVNSKSHASDGWITFARPTDEQPTMFQSSEWFSYWYEVSFGEKTITDDMTISIQVMPFYDMQGYGKCFALSSFKQRAAYGFEKIPGYIAISAAGGPMVLNGSDCALQDVGDGRANRVVAIKRFFNELLVWQEEKGKDGGCLSLIEGYSPSTFGKRVLSTTLGTFSSKTAVIIEGVPYQDPNGKIQRITVAAFLSRYGAYMTDGKNVWMISGDIQDYFDPRDSKCIRKGFEKEHWLDFDSMYQVLRVGLVSGANAEVPNVFLVYDVMAVPGQWSEDEPVQPFSCHAEVEAASGQFSVLQVAGGTVDGTVYRTNYGTSDVTTAFKGSAMIEYDGRGHDLFLDEIVIRSSGSCTLTPYADGVAKDEITIST